MDVGLAYVSVPLDFKPLEIDAEFGPSTFEAGLKAQTHAAAESKKRAEAEQRAKERAKQEATDRAKDAMNELPREAILAFADQYRAGEGASKSQSWSDEKGDFRDTMEKIQFKSWLLKQFKAAQAVTG